ncbi:MAG: DNA-deoxyinosine glycosylase [Prevotellaceae bacterium]|jgi:hypoxanthine-DNA glycosylase|nr:DNA-deoxyinosine glycosylase [Prevotellaceae bacterium]
MKGKNIFTASEIERIKQLINKKVVASKTEQKNIRYEIRSIGFYYSEFRSNKGYTVVDFEDLIKSGEIKISDSNIANTKPINSFSKDKKTSTSDVKTSFPSISDKNTTILILGTIPGEDSLAKNEYYTDSRNRFWKIIAKITNQIDVPLTYEMKKYMLLDSGIGVWDVAHRGIRKGSLDSAIKDEKPNDLNKFIETHKKLKIIAFNGTKAEELFDKYFSRKSSLKYISLPSTSGTNTRFTFEEMCEKWQKIME